MTPERLAELEKKAKHPEWRFAAPKATILDLIAHIRDLEAQVREAREREYHAENAYEQIQMALGMARMGNAERATWYLEKAKAEQGIAIKPSLDRVARAIEKAFAKDAEIRAIATPPSPEETR